MPRSHLERLDSLLADLSHEHRRVRLRAVKQLEKLRNVRAVEPLIARLEDELRQTERWDEDLTFALVAALGALQDVRAIPAIATTLVREMVRDTAVYALCAIGTEAVVSPLIDVLQAEDRYGSYAYRTAVETLGKLGASQAIEPLWKAAQKYRYLHDDVTVECVVALFRLGDMRALPTLIETLQKMPPAAGHRLAARRLRELCSERDASVVVELLQRLDPSIYPFLIDDGREHGSEASLPLVRWIEQNSPQYAMTAREVIAHMAAPTDTM